MATGLIGQTQMASPQGEAIFWGRERRQASGSVSAAMPSGTCPWLAGRHGALHGFPVLDGHKGDYQLSSLGRQLLAGRHGALHGFPGLDEHKGDYQLSSLGRQLLTG